MGKPVMKFLMVGVNVIFWAFGGTLLGVGIWMAVDPGAFDGLEASGMDDAMWAAIVYTMIGVGAFVFLVGFLGCCGATREGGKAIMLKLYIALVSVVLLAEVVIIILTAIFWSSIDDNVRTEMTSAVKTEYQGPEATDGVSVSWNKMQYEWQCCGSNNYKDYQGSEYVTDPILTPVPYTCCVYKSGSDYNEKESGVLDLDKCMNEARGYTYNGPYIYLNGRGCYWELEYFIDQNAAIIIGVTCGVIGLQILGIIFSCCIMKD